MIAIIDDDLSIGSALENYVASCGFVAQSYVSAENFLELCDPALVACLVSDIRMPGMNGLELQRHLKNSGVEVPVIFITAASDESIRTVAMAGGAAGFFLKPFNSAALMHSIKLVMLKRGFPGQGAGTK
jgi:FixJ family two-component response regulator